MNIIKTYEIKSGQYYPTHHEKKQIFLHHTAGGSARSCLNWWNDTPEHIGVAFVIDRDGKIYQAFDPEKWAFHLGIVGDSNILEKTSIGIELVSYGGLYKAADGNWYFRLTPKQVSHQKLVPDSEVIVLDKPFRGFSAFQKYTPEQIISLKELLAHLVKTFNIKIQEPAELLDFWDFKQHVITKSLPGIWTHSNVRKDKSDLYPCEEIKGLVKELVNPIIQEQINKEALISNFEKPKKGRK